MKEINNTNLKSKIIYIIIAIFLFGIHNLYAAEQSITISGANIAIKHKAKTLEEQEASITFEKLLEKWNPEKFITTQFIPIWGKDGEFISSKKTYDNKIEITTYVLLSFDSKKFFSELVPEFSKVLDNIAIDKTTASRNSQPTYVGGFWWGDYNMDSIEKSPFKIQAKYFQIREFVKNAKNYKNEIYLNTSYDNFTIYELPYKINIPAIRKKIHSKKLIVTVNFVDQHKNIVKSFSHEITEKGEYGEVFNFPMYSYYREGINLKISPEFCGRYIHKGLYTYNCYPQMVQKIKGDLTVEELKNIVSMNIKHEIK